MESPQKKATDLPPFLPDNVSFVEQLFLNLWYVFSWFLVLWNDYVFILTIFSVLYLFSAEEDHLTSYYNYQKF